MKIKFELNVPDWARWTTVDKFGVIECWSNEPETWPRGWDGRWHNKIRGRRKELAQFSSDSCRSWKTTLKKI